jgi:ABC-type Fe3+/spermidine/putrescine transport system ATPase subunit
LPGIKPTAKQLLVRPEHVLIETTGKSDLRGIVHNSLFWGNYYTVDVLIDQHLIRVQTDNNLFATGEEVFLSFEPEYVWYID